MCFINVFHTFVSRFTTGFKIHRCRCWSYLGRVIPDDTTKNYQEVSLGAGCISKGIVLHEILHFLGFYHEHTRYDRDEYIKVNWKNIKTGI